ncbi:MAG: alpha/beta hydrolase [Nocardioidaceae bacterium]|nr:alpha/beta hydrolase [Nocardioidaceae bacterium]
MPGTQRRSRSILSAVDGLLKPSLQHRIVVQVLKRRRQFPVGDETTRLGRFLAATPREPAGMPGDFVESPLSTQHLRVMEYQPTLATPRRTLVHVHGGSYTKPIDARHFALMRRIADALGVRLLMPLYALAPEHTWRDSRPALVDLVSSVAESEPEGAVLSGDSAGGGYALSVAQGLRDAGGTMPKRMVLLSPWLNLTDSQEGRAEAARNDPWLSLDHLPVYGSWWAGTEADRARPEVSPLFGDLTGLPPTLLMCGTRDLLVAENRELVRRAADAGWDLTYVEGEEMLHVWPLLPIPEAREAVKQIVEFLSLR